MNICDLQNGSQELSLKMLSMNIINISQLILNSTDPTIQIKAPKVHEKGVVEVQREKNVDSDKKTLEVPLFFSCMQHCFRFNKN